LKRENSWLLYTLIVLSTVCILMKGLTFFFVEVMNSKYGISDKDKEFAK